MKIKVVENVMQQNTYVFIKKYVFAKKWTHVVLFVLLFTQKPNQTRKKAKCWALFSFIF